MESISQNIGWVMTGFGALVGALWAQLNRRMSRQEDNVGKLFDKLEEHSKNDADRFAETFQAVNSNHLEIMRYLRDHKK